jgi:transcriptional regulator with XRE-family HTH domain
MRFKWEHTAALMPKIFKENYDAAAEEFLTRYCPEALATPMAVPIFDIARHKIQMTVIDTERLSKDTNILGMIAFFDGELEVYDSSLDDCIGIEVKSKTALIDPNVTPNGRMNNTMAHECVHWHYHRPYFKLLHKQMAEDIAIRCPKKRIEINDANTVPDIVWMEAQARGIAPRILMPKEMFRIKAKEMMTSHSCSEDAGDRISALHVVVDKLAGFFKVSKVSAKRRLVDLRLISRDEGELVYNYRDDRFVIGEDDSRLIAASRTRALTRQMDFAEFYVEYNESTQFRELMQSGLFVYIGGHVVINDAKYIEQDDEDRLGLSEYAQRHLPECTLLFERRMDYAPTLSAMNFALASRAYTQRGVRSQYSSNAQNDAAVELARSIRAEYEARLAERRATSKTLWERIDELRTAKGLRNDSHLAEKSHLNNATISRIKNVGVERQSLETMMAVCVGLDLELQTAKELLGLAGLALPNDERGVAYEIILTSFKGQSMDVRNMALEEMGMLPLGSKSQE